MENWKDEFDQRIKPFIAGEPDSNSEKHGVKVVKAFIESLISQARKDTIKEIQTSYIPIKTNASGQLTVDLIHRALNELSTKEPK